MDIYLKKAPINIVIFVLACALVFLFYRRSYGYGEPVGKTFFALNTIIEINIHDRNLSTKKKQGLLDGCEKLINGYENKLSIKISGSETDKINTSNGKECIVSQETLELIKTAYKHSQLTGGCFDITVKPLVDLWGINTDSPQIPAAEKITEALQNVGYENIIFTDKGVRMENGAQVDLGAIAKGYIADMTAEYLKQNGCRSALVNLGGNVVAVGAKPGGEKWNVGIREPFSDRNEYVAVLHVTDMSVVTSGSYERFFQRNGKIYHHIIDPSTGHPSESDLSSVTVISKKSVDGDAVSTACFVMGSQSALELLESIPETEGVMIKKDGEIIKTSGIGGQIGFTERS